MSTASSVTAVAGESGPRVTRRMGATIVFSHDLDVLVSLQPMELVLDPEVREVDRLVEVRQLVLVRPPFDFIGVPIGSAVTVRSAPIVCLEPLLVLALEILLEDDAVNLRAGVAESLSLAEIGAIELRIMRQLA